MTKRKKLTEAEHIFCAFIDGFRTNEFAVSRLSRTMAEEQLHGAATRYVDQVLKKEEQDDD